MAPQPKKFGVGPKFGVQAKRGRPRSTAATLSSALVRTTAKSAKAQRTAVQANRQYITHYLQAQATRAQAATSYSPQALSAAEVKQFAMRRSYTQARLGQQNAAMKARISDNVSHFETTVSMLQFQNLLHKPGASKVAANYVDVALRAVMARRGTAATVGRPRTTSLQAQTKSARVRGAQSAKKSAVQRKARGAAGELTDGSWITGRNNHYPTCAAAAVANHLLAATGMRLSDDEVVLLHIAAGGTFTKAPSIEDVLAAISSELLRYDTVGTCDELAVIGYESEAGPHAGLSLHPGYAVAWGREFPVAETEEAWHLEWTCD